MNEDQLGKRVYLGDGLYSEYDGYQFMLSASDGIRTHSVVYLEPKVLDNFLIFVENCGFIIKGAEK